MFGMIWLAGIVRRRTGRILGEIAGVGVAVLLLAALGAFFTASRASMTTQAIGSVPVDWQVQLAPDASRPKADAAIAAIPGLQHAVPVSFADTGGFSARVGGTVRTTGPGKVVGIPAEYATTFPGQLRYLVGAHEGVLLAQQTAANLGATVGTRVTVQRPGQPTTSLVVDGIVDLPTADSFFQQVGAVGTAVTAPPDNVMIVPADTWARLFPSRSPGTVQQIHVDLSHDLPADPGAAFASVVGAAKHLEASLAGAGTVGDNLAARLDAARGDAVYAQMLFLFLGLPGVIIAALLAGVIASSGRERRRREQALLRVRGASPRRITRIAATEAMLVGSLGIVAGLAGAAIVGRLAFGTSGFGATGGQATTWIVASIVFGLGLALGVIALPAWRDARMMTVRGAQGSAVGAASLTAPRPVWARLYLDVVCLGLGGLIYWQAVRNGYAVVLAPEGIPTISVSYFTLLAPLLFWIGAALLTWRIASTALKHGRRVLASATRPLAHRLSDVVAAAMSRQRRALARGAVLVGLTASFALSVAIFNTTYAAQAKVDARLTNGADVSITTTATSGLPTDIASTVRGLPGVAAAEPMQHRFAYVGNDLQDLYGIDPGTIGRATSMSDAFFAGGDASATLASLASTPDGVLVSEETVHDFQLQVGDTVNLRLQTAADHAYHSIPFVYVGVAREFPTAPHDSFLVANASYVARMTGSPATQTLLVRANGSPGTVADSIRGVLAPGSGAVVRDIVAQRTVTLSALTAIDLAGLTKLELSFALLLAVAASGLVLALGLAERRRTFAIAWALGARPSQLGAFVWSEAAFVAVTGTVLGAVAGAGLALAIVKILTGVFDPPPEHLSIPWLYLAGLLLATTTAILVAGGGMLKATRRPTMAIMRDL
ncbi:MAG TPA: FtsX-like permease family protein [Actinomycetota bacterium]|jgi:putative ABC transport system permease protein